MIDKIIKEYGLNSPIYVSRNLGIKDSGHPVVSTKTLRNWHKNKPRLFFYVLKGMKAEQDELLKQKELENKND